MALLETRNVTKRFGGLTAVNDLTFDLDEGAIVSVIGPNGAGKTTFFNCITGFYQIDEGTHHPRRRRDPRAAAGRDRPPGPVADLPEHPPLRRHDRARERARRPAPAPAVHAGSQAVLRTPLAARGGGGGARGGPPPAGLRRASRAPTTSWRSNLPYGDQRRLEIARALGTSPRLLLLDEPTAGMNPAETHEMTDLIRQLRDDLGITILLIEHEMRVVMGISRAHHRARLRRADRRGHAGGDPARPARHRGLPGQGAREVRRVRARHRRCRPGGRSAGRRQPSSRACSGDEPASRRRRTDHGPARDQRPHTYYGKIHALRASR